MNAAHDFEPDLCKGHLGQSYNKNGAWKPDDINTSPGLKGCVVVV